MVTLYFNCHVSLIANNNRLWLRSEGKHWRKIVEFDSIKKVPCHRAILFHEKLFINEPVYDSLSLRDTCTFDLQYILLSYFATRRLLTFYSAGGIYDFIFFFAGKASH